MATDQQILNRRDMSEDLPTLYQSYIHKSKYARWREEEGRRETWAETVDRYVDFAKDYLAEYHTPLSDETYEEIREAILSQDVLPSMRALMTAGPALKRDAVAAYNCAFIAVNRPQAFDEAMYILMCGTGVGFSVERQYVNKLPEIPDELHPVEDVIVVGDSKIGWASAYRRLISTLYSGHIPTWDTTKVRPAGARLKTFGGRASGPGPLNDLFRYTVETFTQARSRKLSSMEAHGLMCKVGDIVVVGGVRRSALISLSNPSDDRMRDAKSGAWYEDPSRKHYALANNSAAWTEKPSIERFMDEWISLIRSKSGERGIFNRNAAQKKVESLGKRDHEHEFGLNPCVTGDTWTMTSEGPRQVKDLLHQPTALWVDGRLYDTTESGFWYTGDRAVFTLETEEGYSLRLTENHQVMTNEGWKETASLRPGDRVKLHNHRSLECWPGSGTFEEGWLLGELMGDGNFAGKMAQLKFWGDSREEMREKTVAMVHSTVGGRSDLRGFDSGVFSCVQSARLADLAAEYGMTDGNKLLTKRHEQASSDFVRGLLRGLFDADGSVQGSQEKGVSVRLAQSDLSTLEVVQRMLLRLGIQSIVYSERRPAGTRRLPDGRGGTATYECRADHELVISNDSLAVYDERVGFSEESKAERLTELLRGYKRTPNRTKFEVRVKRLVPDGIEPVYDCSVPDIGAFDANGLYVHNCGEIILRDREFCNLSQVTVRDTDTVEELGRKVRIASIIGTIQSTFTRFRYLSAQWQRNCEEERLLGVGMTGVMDNKLLNGAYPERLPELLQDLKFIVNETNAEFAEKLGINPSAATTCMKPAGNSTQLVGAHGSGMHEAYAEYYYRRCRGSKADPVSQLMYYSGIPTEDEITHPDTTWVFTFPMKAPEGAITRDDRTAIEKLEHWLVFAEHWCEHNPSITIHVKEEEWLEVGAWVYKHFDKMVGITFLPHSDHTYQQAPYEEITKHEYETIAEEIMPKAIDWAQLEVLEITDTTDNVKELACVSGACEIL